MASVIFKHLHRKFLWLVWVVKQSQTLCGPLWPKEKRIKTHELFSRLTQFLRCGLELEGGRPFLPAIWNHLPNQHTLGLFGKWVRECLYSSQISVYTRNLKFNFLNCPICNRGTTYKSRLFGTHGITLLAKLLSWSRALY